MDWQQAVFSWRLSGLGRETWLARARKQTRVDILDGLQPAYILVDTWMHPFENSPVALQKSALVLEDI